MKEQTHAAAAEEASTSGPLFLTYAVSLIGHLVFFAVLIFSPASGADRRFTPSVINVSMVELPGPDAGKAAGTPGPVKSDPPREDPAPEPKQAEVKVQEKAPEPVPAPEEEVAPPPPKAKPEVSVSPERKTPDPVQPSPEPPKVKESLKKKTFKSSRVVESAIKDIEKRAEESRPQTVNEAIARLKGQVARAEGAGEKKSGGGQAAGGAAGSGRGTGAGGAQVAGVIDIYNAQISYHIQKNWAFSEQLAAGLSNNLQAVVIIKILPNGEIRDYWFDKKSGNSHLDDSALRAVQKSNPLPPLPKAFMQPFYDVGLIFTPSGIR